MPFAFVVFWLLPGIQGTGGDIATSIQITRMASSVEPIKSTKSLSFRSFRWSELSAIRNRIFFKGILSFLLNLLANGTHGKRVNGFYHTIANQHKSTALRLHTGSSGCKVLSASGMPPRAEGPKDGKLLVMVGNFFGSLTMFFFQTKHVTWCI